MIFAEAINKDNSRVPTAQGKWQKKSLSGKTQGILFAQVVNSLILKPIFYCDAKLLASGLASGVMPKYTNMLVYFGITPDAKTKIGVTPDANPRCQSVEYRWRWVFWRWPCIFHVYFMLFVHHFPRWLRDN